MEGPIFTLQIRGRGQGNETPLGLATNSKTDGYHRTTLQVATILVAMAPKILQLVT